ncbi:hypothetical protein HY442_01060 [Candidatus Parcubacteria bacterium]|nr:hypothetical protein [Candidatus Parcubacteria bacterium]
MMFMARYLFPVWGVVLLAGAGSMAWGFYGVPVVLPPHVARTIGGMALTGAATFVCSALAWQERR